MDLANRTRKVIVERTQSAERQRVLRLSYARWMFIVSLLALYGLRSLVWSLPAFGGLSALMMLGLYALYSLGLALASRPLARQQTAWLPPVSLLVDLILALACSWLIGLPFFAIPFAIALLIVLYSGYRAGLLAIVVTAALNYAFVALNYNPVQPDLRAEAALALVGGLLLCLSLAGAVYTIMQSSHPVLKAQSLILEEAIATANTANLEELQNRVKAVYRVATTLSATLDYYKVVRNILVEMESVFEVSVGAVMLFEGTASSLRIVDAEGLSEEEKERTIPASNSVIKEALGQNTPLLINDPEELKKLSKIYPSLDNCREAILMPMRGGYEVYGLLLIASNQEGSYHESDLELMVALTSHTVVAMQNAALYRNLLEDRNKMLTAEEEVRHTLARNLHDGPAQAVAAFSMQTEFIRRLFKSEPDRALEELKDLGKQAQQTSKEIRTLLYELRPLVLESQGLHAALDQYAARFPTNPNDPTVHFSASEEEPQRLSPVVETTIFTILQEAVNNARKHARARNLWLHIEYKDGFVIASAQDDGQGFDTSTVERNYDQRGSLGLTNMRERAALVGGTVNIVSKVGKGTSVIIRIPLTEATLAPSVGAAS